MLVTVIIFLREVLEAALILSVLLAVSFQLTNDRKWILPALAFGFIGASITACFLGDISNLLEGTGQEVMNSTLLIIMSLLINTICVWLWQCRNNSHADTSILLAKIIKTILIVNVSIAIMHEGSELSIYSYSFMQIHESNLSLILGGGLGLGIGASLGAIVYYLLINLQRHTLLITAIAILILISAGMASQAALYLIQSGWLPSQLPLWDTTQIISERSIIGQLLYALIGYEATPSPLQILFYFSSIVICFVSIYTLTKFKLLSSVS